MQASVCEGLQANGKTARSLVKRWHASRAASSTRNVAGLPGKAQQHTRSSGRRDNNTGRQAGKEGRPYLHLLRPQVWEAGGQKVCDVLLHIRCVGGVGGGTSRCRHIPQRCLDHVTLRHIHSGSGGRRR